MVQKNGVMPRIAAFQDFLRKNQLDGFLITGYLDQFYLMNFMFNPKETVLLVSGKKVVCFTRNLYVETLRREKSFLTIVGEDGDRLEAAILCAQKMGLKKIGFDAAKESYLSGETLIKKGCKASIGWITLMRQRKDKIELKNMRASNRLAYQTYCYIRPRIKTGMTESQVAAEMEQFMRAHGASSTSFATIVAFGKNAANPHHVTGKTKLKAEECVLIDFGCVYNGYCSDMTRSWWHGKKAPAQYTEIWNLVDKARQKGIKTVKPGHTGKQVDTATRNIIVQGGYGSFFTHATGHGVGIEIHEDPYNSQQCNAVLAEGNVVTVEPGIYLPGKYGVRLEDTVAVTKTGANILTRK